jgi:polysaccharide chain length determinant protein (PEP-CTERM system associated)
MATEYVIPVDEQPKSKLEPEVVFEIWYRRKWLALLIFSAVLAAALSAAFSLPDLYRSSATVLVDHQEVSEAFVRPSVTAELETRIQTIHQQVTSRARLGGLIERLGLYPEMKSWAPPELVVERMRRDIELKLQGVETSGRNATIAFTLSYNGRDPATVADVANRLVAFYIDENTRSRERQASRTADFLKDQVAGVRRELDEQDRRAADFMNRHSSELPQQLEVNVGALGRLTSSLQMNGERQMRLIERRERLDAERSGIGVAAGATEAGAAEAQLWKLRQDLAALQGKYSETYPDVARTKREITALEGQVARRAAGSSGTSAKPAAGGGPDAYAAIDAQMKALKDEEAGLRRAIAGYEARVESTPSRQRVIEQLSRGQDTARGRYDTLLKQYEDARIAASLEHGQSGEEFRILDPALPPREPTAPNRLWLSLLGVVAALVFSVGGIVAAEKLDTTFHSTDDLRNAIPAPILATIPRVATLTGARLIRHKRAFATGLALAGLALIVAGSWYIAAGNETIARLTARGGL